MARPNLNRTLNSLDEINSMEKYPVNYNVRNNKNPDTVTGEKRIKYNLLEEKRGLFASELSSNYWLIKFMIIIFFAMSCKVVRNESFHYQDKEVYHVNYKSDTTLLNWSDLKVLQIDSLQDYFLEFRAETDE